MVTLFLIHIQTWWAMFDLRGIRGWNFGAFLIVLMQPVCLFIMSALIVPGQSRIAEVADTKAAYFQESRWFLAVLLLALCDNVAKNLVLYGSLPEPPNLAAHLIFFGVALIGLIWQRDKVHKILAPVGLALITSYIGLLFTKLS
jgi:hypothetical protein